MNSPHRSPLRMTVLALEDVVLFPTTRVPLRVEDPESIDAIEACVGQPQFIALSRFEPTDSSVNHSQHLMGYGRAVWAERTPDGSALEAVIQGIGKARLLEVLEESPRFVCALEPVEDRSELKAEHREDFERLTRLLVKWTEAHVADAAERELWLAQITDAQQALEALAQVMIKDSDVQQAVLELNDINERVRIMKFLF